MSIDDFDARDDGGDVRDARRDGGGVAGRGNRGPPVHPRSRVSRLRRARRDGGKRLWARVHSRGGFEEIHHAHSTHTLTFSSITKIHVHQLDQIVRKGDPAFWRVMRRRRVNFLLARGLVMYSQLAKRRRAQGMGGGQSAVPRDDEPRRRENRRVQDDVGVQVRQRRRAQDRTRGAGKSNRGGAGGGFARRSSFSCSAHASPTPTARARPAGEGQQHRGRGFRFREAHESVFGRGG